MAAFGRVHGNAMRLLTEDNQPVMGHAARQPRQLTLDHRGAIAVATHHRRCHGDNYRRIDRLDGGTVETLGKILANRNWC